MEIEKKKDDSYIIPSTLPDSCPDLSLMALSKDGGQVYMKEHDAKDETKFQSTVIRILETISD